MHDINILISSIYREIQWVRAAHNIEPNKIILGIQVYEQLVAYMGYFFMNYSTPDRRSHQTMFGIPIIIDDVNVNHVGVCIEYEVPTFKEV